MTTFTAEQTVGSIVTAQPSLSRVFEQHKIDYCCGGKKPLAEACAKKGLDPQSILSQLHQAQSQTTDEVNYNAMPLANLANHIEETHHEYLRAELPRLDKMTHKVHAVHGEKDPRLAHIRETFCAMQQELMDHIAKEERVLFPMIRQLEAAQATPDFHCGSLDNPISVMEHEHDNTGQALETLRALTDDFTPPTWACNTHRAMVDGLGDLARDIHSHIHKENNILFPRASALEEEKTARK